MDEDKTTTVLMCGLCVILFGYAACCLKTITRPMDALVAVMCILMGSWAFLEVWKWAILRKALEAQHTLKMQQLQERQKVEAK